MGWRRGLRAVVEKALKAFAAKHSVEYMSADLDVVRPRAVPVDNLHHRLWCAEQCLLKESSGTEQRLAILCLASHSSLIFHIIQASS